MSVESHEIFRIVVEIAMAVIGFFVSILLKDIRRAIDEAKTSVDQLNVKVAIVIEKTSNHEKQIGDHSDRLRELEKTWGKIQ